MMLTKPYAIKLTKISFARNEITMLNQSRIIRETLNLCGNT